MLVNIKPKPIRLLLTNKCFQLLGHDTDVSSDLSIKGFVMFYQLYNTTMQFENESEMAGKIVTADISSISSSYRLLPGHNVPVNGFSALDLHLHIGLSSQSHRLDLSLCERRILFPLWRNDSSHVKPVPETELP